MRPSHTRFALLFLAFVLAPALAAAQWETPTRSFHKPPVFPLEGRHLTVPCASCHIKGETKGTPTLCAECHMSRRQDDPYRGRLGMQCEQCHRTSSWTAVKWDHGSATGMPLNAAHKTMGCDGCHRNALFTGVNLSCANCHVKDFESARAPDHRAAGFPQACELCHKPSDATFTQGRFNHASTFPLVGLHATATCAGCHTNGVYQGTPRDCVGCHRTDYQKTTSPNHASAGFSTDCVTCHRPTDPSFASGQTFNHNATFALVGMHATAACATCHVNNVFKGTPRDCVSCHRTDYQKTTSPNHASAGFSTDCASCHRATDPSFGGAGQGFNHNSVFALVGMHATAACATCHVNNVFKGTPRDCVACHRTDYQKTTSPNHASAGFSTDCVTCHRASDASFRSGQGFNHSSVFALVGTHATTACATCHVNNVFKGTPRDCVGCHRTDYNRTTSPNHVAAQFPTTCDSCHKATDASWTLGKFTHSWFPITSGAHKNRACAECHTNPATFTQFTCTTCHGRTETDGHHRGQSGYAYDSNRCYACHPNGKGD